MKCRVETGLGSAPKSNLIGASRPRVHIPTTMPKRKAPSGDTSSNDTSPSKRVTRSKTPSGNKPLLTRSRTGTPRKLSKKAAQTGSPPKTPSVPRVRATSPVKIDHAGESEESDDELRLSPSKTRSRRSGPRDFLDVEPSTPAHPHKKPPKPIPSITSQNSSANETHFSSTPDAIPTSLNAPVGKEHLVIPHTRFSSPIKSVGGSDILRPPTSLPPHLSPCLNAQKRAIFAALQEAPEFSARADDDDEPLTNTVASQQLDALLAGTMTRDEGNSCLILGPRGSGKSRLVERAIKALKDRPIVIRLSGWAQNNDRLAMREVARQLSEQTGQSYLDDDVDNVDVDAENPFAEPDVVVALPPPSHLPALISVLPTLSRPSIVILDSFDLFALHPRQSLLYCLLDTVQNCRAGSGSNGMAVIGVTARIDTINLLEKRAFEMLVTSKIFVGTAASSATTAAEFVKHRCALDYLDVKKAVDDKGQTNLKKWLSKAQ
ncbi:hypothetical protein FIBSPDRAFT_941526 [Athelia psychrophila]|uniref:Orc1-like AAA ATPase domain-containing protein n=1 Tax=Athelia psychrophila TaxID=1759441 RepID=A0A167TZ84_9AGAM|nr:hypothetical protein FIBSPDRAFT_941526 [Fibularhizoctonia sp. CBS 109695]